MNLTTRRGFLDEQRLIRGPWQALERDVARLILLNGFEEVRIVGGTGDRGGDVLGVLNGELWVFQCKHTSMTPPPGEAVDQVVRAGQYYGAQRLVVATSRAPGQAVEMQRERYKRVGLQVDLAPPQELLRWMEHAPEYSPWRRKLHDYQEEASTRFREALLDTRRALAVLATGLGKTVIIAEIVADLLRDGLVPYNRVLVLAHTRELVDQLHKSFWYQLPKWVPTHQLSDGEEPAFWDGITFATIQSVYPRLGKLPEFGLVLVDEAHHIGASMFRQSLKTLAPRMLGGVTATPWRGDEYDVEELLGPPLVKTGIAEGLRRGFLSEVDYRLMADNIDWQFVQKSSKHQYSLAQLNRRLIIPTRDDEAARVVADTFRRDNRRAGIVYSPSLLHAHAFAALLRQYQLRAEVIASETPPRERDKLMSRFRAGELDLVATVDLFNEGVDVPDVDLIVFMRATHSRRIFVQQLGRGLRVSPTKNKVVVLDFVTDLRRLAEVIELDRAVRDEATEERPVEHLGLGDRLVQFTNKTAGDFLREWLLDQASLFLREGEANLELPQFEFPAPPAPGGVQ